MTIKLIAAFLASAEDRRERGAVAGEYAVLLALIAVALITAIGLFTDGIGRAFSAATDRLPSGS